MFQGRYGNDYLNRALSIIAIVFAVLNIFMPNGLIRMVFSAIWFLCIGCMFFRMFSRNFEARRRENEKFMKFYFPLRQRFAAWRAGGPRAKTAKSNPTFEERRKYKYFLCTQCAQRLRVPRGKGKLRVTCTRCGNKFEIKS